ncbi:MAG: YigZ family protein [Bacteroidota bacterium]
MDDTFFSIRSATTAQIKVEGSRFIADSIPVTNENEAKEHLERIKKKYFDATHHCFAYVIGAGRAIARYYDDGEPSGTAGIKILSAIQSKKLSDILIVVTRYFGGTKLGVGGLGRAYFDSALHGIASAEIISKGTMLVVEIVFSFNETNPVMNAVHANKLKIVETSYVDTHSTLRVLVPPSQFNIFKSTLTDATRARAEISTVGEKTIIL